MDWHYGALGRASCGTVETDMRITTVAAHVTCRRCIAHEAYQHPSDPPPPIEAVIAEIATDAGAMANFSRFMRHSSIRPHSHAIMWVRKLLASLRPHPSPPPDAGQIEAIRERLANRSVIGRAADDVRTLIAEIDRLRVSPPDAAPHGIAALIVEHHCRADGVTQRLDYDAPTKTFLCPVCTEEVYVLAASPRPSSAGRSCCVPAPDRSGRQCDKPRGHDGNHWTYGGHTLEWPSPAGTREEKGTEV